MARRSSEPRRRAREAVGNGEHARAVGRRWRAHWTIAAALIGAVLVIGALGLAGGGWRFGAADRLPAPPQAAQPAVADHLRGKYDAARSDPSSIAAVGPLCLAYHADMFFDHADRCYQVARAIDPGDWRWRYYGALIQAERGGGGDLFASLRQVVNEAPRFGPAWLRLGEAEFKAGRYEAAADAWHRVSELPEPDRGNETPAHAAEVPLAAYASAGLARVALVGGNAEQARSILEPLTAAAPGFSSGFRLLADSYRALGRDADAERAIYRANRLPPYTPYADPMIDVLARESRNSTLLLRLASEADLAINADWSEYLTRRAAEFDPDNPEVVAKLGRILRQLGRNGEALPLFMRYHEMVPGDFQGLVQIASCLSALGRYDEAESYFRRALAGLDDPITHFNLGLLMAVTGRLDEAVKEYERALERDPMHSDARSNLAAALARQGKMDRASRELRRVLEHDPENAVARTNLGLVLMQQGQVEQARRELTEALRIDPQLTRAAEALSALKPVGGSR